MLVNAFRTIKGSKDQEQHGDTNSHSVDQECLSYGKSYIRHNIRCNSTLYGK